VKSKTGKIIGLTIWSFVVLIVGVAIGQSPSPTLTTDTPVNETKLRQADEVKIDDSAVVVKSETLKQESGFAKVVGEVINNRKNPVTYVKVTATFYDKDEKVIGTAFTFAGDTSDTPLEYQKTTPFELTSYPDKFVPASYKLDVIWN